MFPFSVYLQNSNVFLPQVLRLFLSITLPMMVVCPIPVSICLVTCLYPDLITTGIVRKLTETYCVFSLTQVGIVGTLVLS